MTTTLLGVYESTVRQLQRRSFSHQEERSVNKNAASMERQHSGVKKNVNGNAASTVRRQKCGVRRTPTRYGADEMQRQRDVAPIRGARASIRDAGAPIHRSVRRRKLGGRRRKCGDSRASTKMWRQRVVGTRRNGRRSVDRFTAGNQRASGNYDLNALLLLLPRRLLQATTMISSEFR